jgi:hypothetical protein
MAMAIETISAQFVMDDLVVADCNKFVQAVAGKVATEYQIGLSEAFAGNADAIRNRFSESPFIPIGKDKALATKLANEGQLVLGGLNTHEMKLYEPKATMGHVVVIAPGGPSKAISEVKLKNGKTQAARGGYPYCYQGAHLSQYRFKEKTQVDVVFPSRSLEHINYAYVDIKKTGA